MMLNELCHWMTARMGDPSRTVAIIDPNGTEWMLGDNVMLMLTRRDKSAVNMVSKLTYIFPGNGDFQVNPPGSDHKSVWFYFENGWGARPCFCIKLDK